MHSIWDKKTWLWIVVIVGLISVPFLNKPVHIDDAFVLRVTANILQHPLDPFYGSIDWHGSVQPVWMETTNPPLTSYFLAPFAAISDYSEVVMHIGMTLFFFFMAWGTVILAQRFNVNPLLCLLFVMLSPAVVVSMNVMRDVPAASLATLAVALFVLGVDKEDRRYLFLGAFLAGLSFFTKYSCIIFLPVLLIYPFLKRKYRLMLWIWPMLLVIGAWCLHNYIMYGQVHIIYLFEAKRDRSGLPRIDMLVGLFVIISAVLYVLPALVWDRISRARWLSLGGSILAAAGAMGVTLYYFNWTMDWEYFFWTITGAMTLYFCLEEGLSKGLPWLKDPNNEEASDSLFLFAWLCASVIFSVMMVPFQAVRHLITALPVLMILTFKIIERQPAPAIHTTRILLYVFLAIQAGVSFVVNMADYEFANLYRTFARQVQEKWVSPDHETYYLGHWGFMFYADRAGLKQRHDGDPFPQPGDIIVRPQFNDVGLPFTAMPEYLATHCETLETIEIPGSIPVRVMNWGGACFYAIVSAGRNLPYRFYQNLPLETFYVSRAVKEVQESDLIRPTIEPAPPIEE